MRAIWTLFQPSDILKILGAVISSLSGILGLLTSFKKKVARTGINSSHQGKEVITTPGKIALIGILLGFGVSVATVIFDARTGQQKEQQHKVEFSILTKPLPKQILVTVWYESPTDEDAPKSERELPELGNIILAKGSKPCSRDAAETSDLIFGPEVVGKREFGLTGGPEFLMTTPNYHQRSYVEETRQYEIRDRNKDAFLGSDELAGSTLIVVLYEEKGTTAFEFRGIEIPFATGSALELTADQFKQEKAQHQTIVDESAKEFGEKGDEPKTIVEHYYCHFLSSQ
ncbi:MAG TPA: hypothetical protein VGF96_16240 [Terracidiphilus sp.]|jgi:hypothetical protein